jgi:hypothetical protein
MIAAIWNRSMLKPALTRVAVACAIGCALASGAQAKTVIYTMRAMADGSFRGVTFSGLPMTIRMVSSTETVKSEPGPNGGTVYTNRSGKATLSIPGFPTATFAEGEVYVRYDTGNGIAGFGSTTISPTYPVAIGCNNYVNTPYTTDCTQGDFVPGLVDRYNQNTYNGIATALADPANASFESVSSETLALPTTLAQSTLVTGVVHECATVYSIDPNALRYGISNLEACSGDAPHGLKTDKGQLFLRQSWWLDTDQSLDYPYAYYKTYMGYLHVEVLDQDD